MLRGVAPNAPVRHEVRATLVVEIVVAERLAVPRRKDAARDTVGTHMVGLPIAVALSHKKTKVSMLWSGPTAFGTVFGAATVSQRFFEASWSRFGSLITPRLSFLPTYLRTFAIRFTLFIL